MEANIRRARGIDYDALCELFHEVDLLHRDHLPRIFQLPMEGPARTREYVQELISNEDAALLVAEVDGLLVGFVRAVIKDAAAVAFFVPRRYAVIDEIGVRSGSQKYGVGRRLMERAQAWAVAQGATSIELNVYEFNETAIAFYEGLGFQNLSRKMNKELPQHGPAG